MLPQYVDQFLLREWLIASQSVFGRVAGRK